MRSIIVLLVLLSSILLLTGLIRPVHMPGRLADGPTRLAEAPTSLADAPTSLADAPTRLADASIRAAETSTRGAGSGAALSAGVANAVERFRAEAPVFAQRCAALQAAIGKLDGRDRRTVARARRSLAECRQSFKHIEYFLEYFFRSSSRIYNTAPKFEAEEGGMEYQSPLGLQVIEAGLFEKNINAGKKELLQQSAAVAGSAADLSSLLYNFHAGDAQLLESLRLELIRVITLDITGYDAPLLKTGIGESYEALVSMRQLLEAYLRGEQVGDRRSDSLRLYLDRAISYLRENSDKGNAQDPISTFDSFDRLEFLTGSALPLQRQLGLLIREKGLDLNTAGVLNNNADHLFSPDALDPEKFGAGKAGKNPAAGEAVGNAMMGQMLFNDRSLSGNGQRSCASCHAPEKMFTDGLVAAAAFDGHSVLDRNTPTLLYSGLQHRQFWDGKASSLEEQIKTVLLSPREMHGDTAHLQADGRIDRFAASIACYIRSLRPMNSPFDRYMNGDKQALSAQAIRGANLFMGRAQCATCHFAPVFNGLIPPYYQVTEFEVLGTTATDRLDRPSLSKDPGRYRLYPFDFLKGAFKTPTVRNAAVTGPYMHNGAFRSLEKVLDFYNKGGGAGLGLHMPSQTLPNAPLHLTQRDMQDIIVFINALTDSLPGSGMPVKVRTPVKLGNRIR